MIEQTDLETQGHFNQRVLDALSEHIAVLDSTGRIIFVNAAWKRFALENGLSDTQAGLGQNYLHISQAALDSADEGVDVAAKELANMVAGKQDAFACEYPCHSPQEERWFRMRATRFTVNDQAMIVISHQDITERHKAEDAMRAAKEEAEQANKAKSVFLSQMSHELRTPLNAILGFSQLMKLDFGRTLSEEQKDQIDEIMHAGNHLLELIDDVLDLAKVEAGKIELVIASCPLDLLLEETAAMIRPTCEAKGQAFQLDNPLPKSTQLVGDPRRLRQILLNLLSNAVKYNKPSGRVRLNVEKLPHDMLRIRVTDDGNGIEDQDLQRLFKPFQRLSQHAKLEGTGIGLALCKELISQMDGNIGVSSQVGIGSTFWIDVPMADASEPDREDRDLKPKPTSLEAFEDQPSILYIEDNPANMKVVAQLLKYRGIRLIEATLPSEGIALAQSERPDLILLDMLMPEMNGYEVLAHLKGNEATQDIPVIIVSANAMKSDIKKAREYGIAVYLTKPLDLVRFNQMLDEHLTKAHRN